MTVRGTVHVSPSDFAILYPHICSLLLKTTANEKRALDLHIAPILEFLGLLIPQQTALTSHAFSNERLLQQEPSPLERIPSAKKLQPNAKFTAARLKIKHETMWRTAPHLARKLWKEKIVDEGGKPGDEVWVHNRPHPDEITRYLSKCAEDIRDDALKNKIKNGVPGIKTDGVPPDDAGGGLPMDGETPSASSEKSKS